MIGGCRQVQLWQTKLRRRDRCGPFYRLAGVVAGRQVGVAVSGTKLLKGAPRSW